MKAFFFVLIAALVFTSCFNPFNETVRGNGNIKSEERNIGSFKNIRCSGSYDVEITQGTTPAIKIETDENLLPDIETTVNGDELRIRSKEDVNINPSDKIKVYVTVTTLEGFTLSGSGDVKTMTKLSGGDHLDLEISGSGDLHFDVNTPTINSSISGSGDIYVTGETKNSKIEIAGSGNYHADGLKSENVSVQVAGSGDAWVFADSKLNIDIAGIGNVYYKGNATVDQKIAGTGKIQKQD